MSSYVRLAWGSDLHPPEVPKRKRVIPQMRTTLPLYKAPDPIVEEVGDGEAPITPLAMVSYA